MKKLVATVLFASALSFGQVIAPGNSANNLPMFSMDGTEPVVKNKTNYGLPPLVIVDGKPLAGALFQSINPNDIVSIEVVKKGFEDFWQDGIHYQGKILVATKNSSLGNEKKPTFITVADFVEKYTSISKNEKYLVEFDGVPDFDGIPDKRYLDEKQILVITIEKRSASAYAPYSYILNFISRTKENVAKFNNHEVLIRGENAISMQ